MREGGCPNKKGGDDLRLSQSEDKQICGVVPQYGVARHSETSALLAGQGGYSTLGYEQGSV